MGDEARFTGEGDNTEYKIHRHPDLQVVSTGAKIHYSCDWKSGGRAPEVASERYWGPRDGISWYSYSQKKPDGFFQRQLKRGPLTSYWDLTWDADPGQYTVISEIRDSTAKRGTDPTFCFLPQQIGDARAMVGDFLNKLLKQGQGPSPAYAEREITSYRKVLDQIAKKLPGPDAKQHQKVVDNWTDLADRLRGLLAPSDDKKRFAVRGMHLELETQAQRPLLLFLTELGDVHRVVGKGGVVTLKQWGLVDWTDASHPRFRGHYEGEGGTAKQAIQACLSSWDWGNSYPAGHVTYEIPSELRAIVGGDVRREMDCNGTSLTDEIIVVFQWIAIGAMLVAGFCFIFLAVPALTSAAMATSMLASTAGAVFSIAQRWRDGLFDWKADAMDGLTILSNLVGAGAWARGARVRLLGQGGKKLDYIFLGARLGSDAVQGILIVDSKLEDLNRLMTDPSYPPEERARKMLALFAELTAVGLMTAISFKASANEASSLSTKPKYLDGGDTRASVPQDKIDRLVQKDQVINNTRTPVAEGHTKNVTQRTTVNTGVVAVEAGPRPPKDTVFAKAYAQDGHPWRTYSITETEIDLMDKDGFVFHATCKDGTLDITIVTVYEGNTNSNLDAHFNNKPGKSTVLIAKDLYPKMYKHFEQVGNPVTRLEGMWAWSNYNDAKVKFDELVRGGMAEDAAAKVAVTYARSYIKYHKPMGFTNVTWAQHDPGPRLFHFVIEQE